MAQMLFYEDVAPVSKEKHKDLSVEVTDYGFAREVNAVPLMAVEIPFAAREYSIVFTGTDEALLPAVILGIEGNKNLYVDEDGKWTGQYVPAFVRRYPFVFSKSPDGTQFTLCIDEKWKGCNTEGKGQKLFDEQGEKTEYIDNLLKFLEDYQRQFARTQAFCARLKELDVLEPMKADFTLADGEKKSLTGFLAVSREKLAKIPAEKIGEMMKTGELELTYSHLISMNNFGNMLKRPEAAPAPATPA